jgi:hypothetical protein
MSSDTDCIWESRDSIDHFCAQTADYTAMRAKQCQYFLDCPRSDLNARMHEVGAFLTIIPFALTAQLFCIDNTTVCIDSTTVCIHNTIVCVDNTTDCIDNTIDDIVRLLLSGAAMSDYVLSIGDPISWAESRPPSRSSHYARLSGPISCRHASVGIFCEQCASI